MSEELKAYEALTKPGAEGVFPNEPMAEYNKKRLSHISSGYLKIARDESLQDLDIKLTAPQQDLDTAAYLEGRAAHVLILEGKDKFLQTHAIGGPVNPKTGKEYGVATAKFADARAEAKFNGLELVPNEIMERIARMEASCQNHTIIRDVLSKGVAELTIRVKINGVSVQVRLDWLSPVSGIIDLKTTEDIQRFERDARYKFGYFYAAALYRRAVFEACGFWVSYSFVVSEKGSSNKSGFFTLDDDLLDHYSELNNKTLVDIRECFKSQTWPNGYEEPRIISLS